MLQELIALLRHLDSWYSTFRKAKKLTETKLFDQVRKLFHD